MSPKQKNWKRGTASLLVFSLLSFYAIGPASAQAPAGIAQQDSSFAPKSAALLFSQARLPSELGQLKQSFAPEGHLPGFIIVQDAHDIPDAQRSVQGIIEFFHREYGVRLVGLEGASGPLDTTLFRAFPDRGALQSVFEDYLSRGEISGALLTAILGPQDIRYYGLEDSRFYEKDIDAYLDALEARSAREKELGEARAALETLKKEKYSTELLDLDHTLTGFDARQIELAGLLYKIEKMSHKKGAEIRKSDYPNLRNVLDHLKVPSEKEFLGLRAELRAAAAKIEKDLRDPDALRQFHEKDQAYETERISAGEFAAFLMDDAGRRSVKLALSQALRDHAENFRWLKQMEGSHFFSELEAYTRAAKEKLFRSALEKQIDALSQQLGLLEKTVRLELSRDEWKKGKEAAAKTPGAGFEETRALEARIAALAGTLTSSDSPSRKFYELAQQREKAMLENMGRRMAEEKAPAAIIVTGGFHSEGLMAALEERGAPYLLVTPKIEAMPENPDYVNHMQGQVSWKNYFKPSRGRIRVSEAFSEAAADKLVLAYRKTNPQSEKTFLKNWRDNVLRQLAGENRLAEAARSTSTIDEIGVRGMDPAEREKIRTAWFERVESFLDALRERHAQGELTPDALLQAMNRPTAASWTSVMIAAPKATVPVDWTRVRYSPRPEAELSASAQSELRTAPEAALESQTRRDEEHPGAAQPQEQAPPRAELRLQKPTPILDEHSVVSFQMEAGLPPHFLEWVAKQYGEEVADRVAQSTVTGGLGALMPDLFETWKANNTNVISVQPIWEEIKNVPQPPGGLGQYLRKGMEDTGISFQVDLTITSGFRAAVIARGSKAKQILDKKIKVRAFKSEATYYKTPQYYLDAYYLKDESQPDIEENRVRIFDEVYNDDGTNIKGKQYWRYVHMAIYRQAGQKLILELQKRNLLKKDLLLIDNEQFVSLPANFLPAAKKHHINHTVYTPGLEEPGEEAFELLGFPEWMRPLIVHNKRIRIADYVGLTYDLITGVGLAEHTPKLKESIFPAELETLQGLREDDVRSTNGAFLRRWQAEERRSLIEATKTRIGIAPETDDKDFFIALAKIPEAFETFKIRNEYVGAMSVAKFLVWLRKKQGKGGASDWLHSTFKQYRPEDVSAEAEEGEIAEFVKLVHDAAMNPDARAAEAQWQELDKKFERLRETLMQDPIVSNVRRQVPYKGPDKWKDVFEFLQNPWSKDQHQWFYFFSRLKQDQSALQYFKENAPRIVIGGRVFGPDDLKTFETIKSLIREMGLEDRVTTIENYNIREAPILFQAMSGVVMIADEFLEASATSMMKGATNLGEIIGVVGGANLEIWSIVDKETGKEIEVLDKDGKPIVTHDELQARIARKEWEVTNGRVVWFLPYGTGPGREESNLKPEGHRRPSAESLALALVDLKTDYKDPAVRRQRQYNVLAASYKVDMQVGQSRAHRQLWERMLEVRQRKQKILDGISYNLEDVEKLYNPQNPVFDWRILGGHIVQRGRPGLPGLMEGFRRLRSQGDGLLRGQNAVASLRHHAWEERHNGGSIFPYIKALLAPLSDAAQPLRDRIDELAAEAAGSDDRDKVLRMNLRALDLVDRFMLQATGQFFEHYLKLTSDQPDEVARYEKVFEQKALRKHLIRFLDSNAKASPLTVDEAGMHAYRYDADGKQMVVAINLRRVPVSFPGETGAQKAWGNLIYDSKLKKFWEDLDEPSGRYLFQAYEPNKDRRYRFYDGSASKSPVLLGVPAPASIQVLTFDKIEAEMISYLSSAIHKKPMEGVVPLEIFIERIKAAQESGEDLKELLMPIASLDKKTAARLFSQETLPSVMALVSFLAPSLLRLMHNWDIHTYRLLARTVRHNSDVFEHGKIDFPKPSNQQTTLVLSRTFGDQRLVLPVQLTSDHVSTRDTAPKVWTFVTALGEGSEGLGLDRNTEYEPYDLIRKRYYGVVQGSQLLQAGWEIGIPIWSREWKGKTPEYPLGFQLIDLRKSRNGQDRVVLHRQEAVAAPKLSHLKVSVNLKEIGAVVKDGKIRYEDSLNRGKQLLRTLRARGAGKVYFYGGLYEMTPFNGQVHRGRKDKSLQYTTGRDGRVVGTVRDYPTKLASYKDPATGAAIQHEDDLNPFSGSMEEFNAQLSATRDQAGSSEKTQQLLRELINEAHALGMSVTLDFIPWLAPDKITEENYHWTFYKEISDDENRQFVGFDEGRKLEFLKELARRNEGHVAVRIGSGSGERVILVRHLQGLYAPNVDQIMLNPFVNDVREYYIRSMKKLIDLGVDEVRIDMAETYLREYFLGDKREGWDKRNRTYFSDEYGWSMWKSPRRKPGIAEEIEKNLHEIDEPWTGIFEAAKDYDPRPEGKKLRFNTESYNPDLRRKLHEVGAEGAYYPDVFENLVKAGRGRPVYELLGALEHALHHGDRTTIYFSNFDQFPFIKSSGGISRKAATALLLVMAHLGVDVMIDLRDWLEFSGQLFPIPGGDQHPDRMHDHPFASQEEAETLLNFDRLIDAVQDASVAYRIQELLDMVKPRDPGLPRPIYRILANQDPGRFVTLGWEEPTGEWKIFVADLWPQQGQKLGYVKLPGEEALPGAVADYKVRDASTHHRFDINETDRTITGISLDPDQPYRILTVERPELRTVSRGSAEFWGEGKAAERVRAVKDMQQLTRDFLEPHFARLRGKIEGMGPSQEKDRAAAVLKHLESLAPKQGVSSFYAFEEQRWLDGSYYYGTPAAHRIDLGLGVFDDEDFAAQILFAAGVRSYAQRVRGSQQEWQAPELADQLAKAVFGTDSEVGFQRTYREFSDLSTAKFLYPAAQRFKGFISGNTYIATDTLFADWLQLDIKNEPHPVISQAGYLAKKLWQRNTDATEAWRKVKAFSKPVTAGLSVPSGILAANERDKREAEAVLSAFFNVILPLIAFSEYRDQYFLYFSGVRQSLLGTMQANTQFTRDTEQLSRLGRFIGGAATPFKAEDFLAGAIRRGNLKFNMPEPSVLAAQQFGPLSREAFDRTLKTYQETLSAGLLAPPDWYHGRQRTYGHEDDKMYVDGLGRITNAEANSFIVGFSGYEPLPGLVMHHNNLLKSYAYAVLAQNPDVREIAEGVRLATASHVRTGAMVGVYRTTYYDIDEAANTITEQRYPQHLWSEILGWLHGVHDHATTTQNEDIQHVFELLLGMRKRMTPQNSRPSYYAPGGVDMESWVRDVMMIQEDAEASFWHHVRSHYPKIKDYMDLVYSDNPTEALLFWYYSLFTRGDSLFARLAQELQTEKDSDRLTPQSARVLIDSILALYWSGMPRTRRDMGFPFLLDELMNFIHIHPDGISVPDLEAFKKFLAPEGAPESFNEWQELFRAAFPGSVQFEPPVRVGLMHEGRHPDPDSNRALMRTRAFGKYSPEPFPADNFMNLAKHPWYGIKDPDDTAKPFTDKEAVWVGTYGVNGVRLPGTNLVFKASHLAPGTLVKLTIREDKLTFEPYTQPPADQSPEVPEAVAPAETVVQIPVKDAARPFGMKGTQGSIAWEIVPQPEASAVKQVAVDEQTKKVTGKIEEDGFYNVPLTGSDLLRFPLAARELAVHIRGRQDKSLIVQKSGDSITFYARQPGVGSEALTYLGRVVVAPEPKAVPGTTDAQVLTELAPAVAHLNPRDAVEYLGLNALAAQLKARMSSGRGYTKIELLEDEDAGVQIDLTQGTVSVSRSLLHNPAAALTKLEEVMESRDPLRQIEEHKRKLEEIWKQDTFNADIEVPAMPERYTPEQMTGWPAANLERYGKTYEDSQALTQRIKVARKLDQYRVRNTAKLGKLGSETAFRFVLRNVLEYHGNSSDASFYFKSRDGSTFYEVPALLRTETGRVLNDGMGLATASHYAYHHDATIADKEKDYYQLTTTTVEAEHPYLFIRYKRNFVFSREGAAAVQKDMPVVVLFDLETGEQLLQEQFEFASRREKLGAALSGIFEDAVKAKTELDMAKVQTYFGQFLEAMGPDNVLESLDRKITVLGNLKQILPHVLDSTKYTNELNYAVLRMIFTDLLREGPEKAVARSEALTKALAREPKRVLNNLQTYLVVHNDYFDMDMEWLVNAPEEAADRARFANQFEDFVSSVILPAVHAPEAGAGAWTEEIFLGTTLEHAHSVKGHIETVLAEHPGVIDENGAQWLDTEEARRNGLIKTLDQPVHPTQGYFAREFFRKKREAAVAAEAAQRASEEERRKQQVSAPEAKVRATYLTPYGGVQGIGASSTLVEYQGSGQEEKDLLLVDMGVKLDGRLTPPRTPRQLDHFPGKLRGVFLTHAHLDHVGHVVPFWRDVLKKKVPIYVTQGTYELLPSVLSFLADSIAQEKGAGNEEINTRFTREEAEEFLKSVIILETGKWYSVTPKMKVYFHGPVGHLHGAASLIVSTPDSTTFLSGDVSYSRQGTTPGFAPIPQEIAAQIDQAQIESTYGMADRVPDEEQERLLVKAVSETLHKDRGRVLLPVFANGRSDRVLSLLLENFASLVSGGMDLKIYVDGQAAAFIDSYLKWKAQAYAPYRELLRNRVVIINDADYVTRGRQRAEILERDGGQKTVIIASPGNMSSGRSLFYATRLVNDPNAGIFPTGYMDPLEKGSELVRAKREGATHFDFHEEVGALADQRVKALLRWERIDQQDVGELLEPLRETLKLGPLPLLARIEEFKLSGHISGPDMMEHVLGTMPNLRQVLIGHGEPARSREVAQWIKAQHAEWNPIVMQLRQRRPGPVPALVAGLDAKREFFNGLTAEPLPQLVAAQAQLPVTTPEPETPPPPAAEAATIKLVIEGNAVTAASRRDALRQIRKDKPDILAREARERLAALLPEGSQNAAGLGESTIRTDLKTLKAEDVTQSELRAVAAPVLEGLADENLRSEMRFGSTLERFLEAVEGVSFQRVAYAMEVEARETPRYLALFAADHKTDRAARLLSEARERLRARHPDHEQEFPGFVREMLRLEEANFDRYLQAPQGNLDFSFGFQPQGSVKAVEWLSGYIDMVERLKKKEPLRVKADIQILLTPEEKRGLPKEFVQKVEQSEVAHFFELHDNALTQIRLDDYLKENGRALIYSFSALADSQKYGSRIVHSSADAEHTVPVALLLTSALAHEDIRQITAELLRRIPAWLPEIVTFNNGRLEITTVALELMYRHEASELISSMA